MSENSILYKPAFNGDLKQVRLLLDKGAKASEMDDNLSELYSNNQFEIVQLLINYGADKYKVDSSPLISLVKMADMEDVKKYVSNGADINAANALGQTALTWLALNGSLKPERTETLNDYNQFRKAVDSGMSEYEAWHEGYDMRVNIRRRDKAFLNAVNNSFLEIAEYLINNGADVNVKAGQGDTPLIVAAEGVLAFIQVFIKSGADINAQNNFGMTALMTAAGIGNNEAADMLIKAGANVNLANSEGRTALDIAQKYSYTQTIALLKAAGAKPGANTRTLLDIVKDNDLAELDRQIANFANVNMKNSYGYTPLMIAAENKSLEAVKKLIAAGAIINAQTKSGWSALMAAGKNNDIDMIKILLEAGADKTLKSKVYNRTAAIWASDKKAKDLLS